MERKRRKVCPKQDFATPELRSLLRLSMFSFSFADSTNQDDSTVPRYGGEEYKDGGEWGTMEGRQEARKKISVPLRIREEV